MITVFTPTYNRAYILPILYESLVNQSFKNFEWFIVDDGSTDTTKELVESFLSEKNIKIRYFLQENQGKHVAINNGAELAEGDLFFIVDSDDYLAQNALEILYARYLAIKENPKIAGIFINCTNKNPKVTHDTFNLRLPKEGIICTLTELNHQFQIRGEFATAIKTEIQKAYPYPIFEGEKFCRESLVYRRIGKKYNFLFVSDEIYFADYLEDGLTVKSWKLLKKSPKGAALLFKEQAKENIPTKEKLIALNAYWDFQINDVKSSWFNKFNGVPFFLSIYVLLCKKFKIKI